MKLPAVPRPPKSVPRPPREEDFSGHLHDPRLAARLGRALGIAFGICFLTGLLSHWIQIPPAWFAWPTRPVSLYRITQGIHVLTGIAAVPLLLAKLYVIYPKLFAWPPVRSPLHAIERGSVLVLVGSAFFELVSGLLNVAGWYPWGFFFPRAHYAVAWVAIGSILVHIAVKLPIIRSALGEPLEDADPSQPTRRTFLVGAGVASAVVVVASAGATVPWLRRVSVLASRSGDGPQGLPVNKSARSAGVLESAVDPAWRLVIAGPSGEVSLSRAEMAAMAQTTATLPIACVEGWSASARWTGVPIRDLAAMVAAPDDAELEFTSLQEGGLYSRSLLPARHVRDELSLLALAIDGADLDIDHGYPCRLITASRPGVLQTKWVARIEVVA